MAYFDKIELAKYIIKKHEDEKGLPISPVKLQKTLYLLYAMWGGQARIFNENLAENSLEYSSSFQEDLFRPSFEAWKFGPVDREVYYKFKNDQFGDVKDLSFKTDLESSTLVPFVNDIIKQCFAITDFSLVDITHEDLSWQRVWESKENLRQEMCPDEIKAEYVNKILGQSLEE